MKKYGWGISVLFALFMLAASVAPKLLGAEVALDPLIEIGWPTKYVFLIGFIELLCTILFLVPRTSLLGCILMTGLFGGAIASHLRAESPLFSHTLFSVYLGIFMWLALRLRDESVRRLFPLKIK
ncbi:DoxX family protein [Ketobacter sp. MCCC 1A13808]|uniref:DoxX family protein n=1 Tax=Ketobacter sp. MCCC 1A13808 TaxID=2602738 RepID=UPI0012EB39DC|nr:DoxX family protein [Ketobacter sp. MCCC 1A13808]